MRPPPTVRRGPFEYAQGPDGEFFVSAVGTLLGWGFNRLPGPRQPNLAQKRCCGPRGWTNNSVLFELNLLLGVNF